MSDIDCSPIQPARPGSAHGDDVVAYNEVNPEWGGRPGFDRFCAALQAHGMGQLRDRVPNRTSVLSEMPATWRLALRRWRYLNAGERDAGGNAGPSAADQYLLHQTLRGTLPDRGLDAASLKLMRFASRLTCSRRPAHRRVIRAGRTRLKATKQRLKALFANCLVGSMAIPSWTMCRRLVPLWHGSVRSTASC